MHEGVGGSGRSGGGLEGGPVPRASLAHSGGRRWEGGRPGLSPAPGLAQQSSSCGCSRAAAALWPGPRLVPGAEGRGAGGAARPALSGSRPRGGASSARAPQLLGACRRTRSPSSHRSAAAGCFAACGMLSGLARPAFLSEDPAPPPCRPPARSGLGAARWVRGGERPPTALTLGGHPASADRGGALGRMGMGGRLHRARRPAVRRRGRVPLSPLPPLLAGRPPILPVPRDAIARGPQALAPSGGRRVPHLSACASARQGRRFWCEDGNPPGAGNPQDAGP